MNVVSMVEPGCANAPIESSCAPGDGSCSTYTSMSLESFPATAGSDTVCMRTNTGNGPPGVANFIQSTSLGRARSDGPRAAAAERGSQKRRELGLYRGSGDDDRQVARGGLLQAVPVDAARATQRH